MANNKRIEVPIVAVTDERALRESDRKLRDHGNRQGRSMADILGNAGTDGAKMFGDNFERSFRITPAPFAQITNHADRAARSASAKLREGLREGVQDGLADATASFGRFSGIADGALQGVVGKAGGAGVAVAGLGLAAVAAGQQLYKLGAQWDEIVDGMAGKTGKLGDELDRLTGATKNIASNTASPLQDIGQVVAAVSQATGATGRDLESLSKTVTDFQRITGQNLDMRNAGKLFRLFDVKDAQEQVAALDQLAQASWSTGATVDSLVQATAGAGKAAKQMGLDLGQTAGLIASLEQAGLDFTKVETGLTRALKTFAAAGREPADALRETIAQIQALSNAGRDQQATTLASATFGKSYIDFLNAIKDGSLDVDSLTASLASNGNTIADVADETADLEESWQKLKNTLMGAFEPAATKTFNSLNTSTETTIEGVKSLGNWVTGLATAWDSVAKFIAGNPLRPTVVAQNAPTPPNAPNPLDVIQGNPGGPRGTTLDDLLGLAPPAAAPTLPPPGIRPNPWGPVTNPTNTFYEDWYPTPNSSGGSGGRGAGNAGPVVPFAGDPMSLLQGLPVTASLYSSANSLLEAQNKVQQETAELNVIMRDNTKTADEVNRARNELADAERQRFQAELSLNEQKRSATEAFTSTMEGATSAIGDIGAALDSDLGISKGLPGLADNLVRFLANLATAPLQGILSKIANPGGASQGGAIQSYAQYGMPSYGGYAGDAALLSRVPSGTYTQENRGDLTQGLADCSSAVEDLVNMLDGLSTGGASVTTHNMEEFLRSRGFMPGPGGPGDMRVGFDAGHAQATLPGGTHFNWGSQAAAAAGGRSGQGSGVMENQFFRPVATIPTGAPSTPFMPQAGNSGGLVIPPPMSSAAANANPALTNPALTSGLPAPGTVPTGGPLSSGFPNAFSASYAPTTPSEQAAPSWQPQGGGNLGSGFLGMAMGLASGAAGMGANAFAPGSGAAAQAAADMAQKAIQRTIAFGGQAAGIGMQGLMETFGVSDPDGGGNGLGVSWLQRIAGGLAGMKPAGGQGAGKQDKNSQVDPNDPRNQQQPGQNGQPGQPGAQGQQPPTVNITNNLTNGTQRDNPQQLMNDLGHMQQQVQWQ